MFDEESGQAMIAVRAADKKVHLPTHIPTSSNTPATDIVKASVRMVRTTRPNSNKSEDGSRDIGGGRPSGHPRLAGHGTAEIHKYSASQMARHRRYSRILRDNILRIARTSLGKPGELAALCELPDDIISDLIARAEAGEYVSAKAMLPKADGYNYLRNAWGKATIDARVRFISSAIKAVGVGHISAVLDDPEVRKIFSDCVKR